MSIKIDQYRTDLAHYFSLDAQQISFYWKGRIGLFGILQALDIKANDEVILPAFTCVVVPNAIIYLGAKPIYVDIDPATYNINCDKVEEKITKKTKVIIAQNTFGLSSDVDRLAAIAKKYNLRLIEDCTHGFGGTYKGQLNGLLTEAAFFSTQWNKPFSTGIGGFVVCRNKDLAKKMMDFEKSLERPNKGEERMLSAQLFVRQKIMKPTIYWPAIKLYRYLSKKNIITGSSQGPELEKPEMPEDYLKTLSSTQATVGVSALKKINKNITHRKIIAELYQVALIGMGKINVFEPAYAKHTFVKFPLLVNNRNTFLELAAKNRIPLTDWFNSPLHPIEKDFELWFYHYGDFPIAEKISEHILNLPTDLSVSIKEAKRYVDFLNKNADVLLDELR